MGINTTGIIDAGQGAWDKVIPVIDDIAIWIQSEFPNITSVAMVIQFGIAILLGFWAFKIFGKVIKLGGAIAVGAIVLILLRAIMI